MRLGAPRSPRRASLKITNRHVADMLTGPPGGRWLFLPGKFLDVSRPSTTCSLGRSWRHFGCAARWVMPPYDDLNPELISLLRDAVQCLRHLANNLSLIEEHTSKIPQWLSEIDKSIGYIDMTHD